MNHSYRFLVEASSEAKGAGATRSLLQNLQETDGVVNASRTKVDDTTMDLGTALTVIMTSGATLAVAQGIADWLRRTPNTTVTIERITPAESIKAEVNNIDAATALRITEIIRGE